MSAWPASAMPVSRAPCTKLTTPGGKPLFSQSFTASSPTAGVISLGLKTTVLPANSAGTTCPFGRCAGKLNGPNTATTPCGL